MKPLFPTIRLSKNQKDILEEILDCRYTKGDDENNPTMIVYQQDSPAIHYCQGWNFGTEKTKYVKKEICFSDEYHHNAIGYGYDLITFTTMGTLKGAIKLVEKFIKQTNLRVAKLLLNRLKKEDK